MVAMCWLNYRVASNQSIFVKGVTTDCFIISSIRFFARADKICLEQAAAYVAVNIRLIQFLEEVSDLTAGNFS
jgi:hypothetical protein